MTDSVSLSFETGENLTLRGVLRMEMGNGRTEVVRGGWRDSSEAAMRSLALDAGLRLRAVIAMYDKDRADNASRLKDALLQETFQHPTKEEHEKLAAEARELARKNKELERKNAEMRRLLQRIYTAIISTGRLINEELGPRE